MNKGIIKALLADLLMRRATVKSLLRNMDAKLSESQIDFLLDSLSALEKEIEKWKKEL